MVVRSYLLSPRGEASRESAEYLWYEGYSFRGGEPRRGPPSPPCFVVGSLIGESVDPTVVGDVVGSFVSELVASAVIGCSDGAATVGSLVVGFSASEASSFTTGAMLKISGGPGVGSWTINLEMPRHIS